MPRRRQQPRSSSPAVRQPAGMTHVPRLVMSGENADAILERELRGVVVTGALHGGRAAHPCNVVEAVFEDLTVDSVDFTSCDFKDSSIRSSRFVRSTFAASSLTYDSFVNVQFESCTFSHTDIQNCEFIDTSFIGCDVRNLLIKTCTFSRCTFTDCQANNKLLETCRLIDSEFRSTELQVQTLAENFGLTKSGYDGLLRDGRSDLPHRRLTIEELPEWLEATSLHPLQKASVDYFLRETFLNGSAYLDASLKLDAWSGMFRTAGSFIVSLNQWVDFLLWLFERGELTCHTILSLHSMTGKLLKMLEEAQINQHAMSMLNGSHLSLSRLVDVYLTALSEFVQGGQDKVVLLVEGHGTKEYYPKALRPMFERAPAEIESVIPHNSPWELTITFTSASSLMFFAALFLATRTQIELSRIRSRRTIRAGETTALVPSRTRTAPANEESARSVPLTESIFALEFGGAGQSKNAPAFRLKAYLPGNLMAELKLTIGSRQVARLRQTLKDVL